MNDKQIRALIIAIHIGIYSREPTEKWIEDTMKKYELILKDEK